MILHIIKKEVWKQSKQGGEYRGDSLASEGFIHCSKPDQVIEVADYVFQGTQGLILLVIDEDKVTSEIKYENPGNNKLYPHIYGPLNIDAVIKTIDFPTNEDGTFSLPELD
ncbi:MAG: DUF952 domain-containing protein [Candidatus Paceibacteria bacterium]